VKALFLVLWFETPQVLVSWFQALHRDRLMVDWGQIIVRSATLSSWIRRAGVKLIWIKGYNGWWLFQRGLLNWPNGYLTHIWLVWTKCLLSWLHSRHNRPLLIIFLSHPYICIHDWIQCRLLLYPLYSQLCSFPLQLLSIQFNRKVELIYVFGVLLPSILLLLQPRPISIKLAPNLCLIIMVLLGASSRWHPFFLALPRI
jgi:hypothetical protein